MQATSVSGQIDIPITVGSLAIGALVALWLLHRLTINFS